MFHRVNLNETHTFNDLYYKRNMVCEIKEIFALIDSYLERGQKFGSIEQCLKSQNYFHLVFDDGFKEHLETAIILKNRYPFLNYYDMSFSINLNNSLNNIYSGMDVVYELIKQKKIFSLNNFIGIKENNNFDIENIKKKLSKSSPSFFNELNEKFKIELRNLKKTFLNEVEIIELSKLFQINSHGMYHRFLTYNKKYSKDEIIKSKNIIEKVIKKPINTFCYPEGKNDKIVQTYVNVAGFKYALSIRHEPNNNFCIGRIIK